ncbi:hypothetical protein LZ009_17480 [Ramlibacter sp. XY19]|uniref:hypothetical protein n=1 Tax=Ramlibacter paludis TaxID=2908000 RepID=UPI0023DB82BF|nr:hypothetical protein [Ramlibacter paludis]MCG2594572.1 hypothetical protein [Ramlibacter paludis]
MARTLSAQVAATVRPWGLLTAIALGYAAYTLHTGMPERTRHIAAPRLPSLSSLQLPEAPRFVLKCLQDGVVTYSDRPCPSADVLLLP